MKTVFKFIKPYSGIVLSCLLLKTVASFCELAVPKLLAYVIDDAVPAGDMRLVWMYGGGMLAFALASFLFNILGNRRSAVSSSRVGEDLRHALFEKTLHLDAASTDKLGISSLISRITADTYNITSFLARMQRMGVRAPLMIVGGVIITLTIDWRMALVMIGVLPLVCLTVYGITAHAIPIYEEEQRVLDRLVRKVDETAAGIRVVKALSKTEYEKEKFHAVSDELSGKEIYAGSFMSLTKPLTDLILNLGLCAVILLGSYLAVRDGYDAPGKLLAFMTYFTIILNSMISMTRIFVQASRSIASARRIEEVLCTENMLGLLDTPAQDGPYLCFEDVSFSYNKRTPDVSHLSFSLEQGQTLGIIGPTGSGKSTLLQLLLRMYDPDSGVIRLAGRDIRSIPPEQLHTMFGVTFQNDFLPTGTLRDNVAFYRPGEDGEVLRALSVAQAADLVSEQTGGLDREVTSRATNLSGGQKQRVLIARALFSHPQILILDDASSALDYKTDRDLRAAIRENADMTAVIVAQRISSVRHADKILVMEQGRIIGMGTHDELMASCAEYRRIAEVQMGIPDGQASLSFSHPEGVGEGGRL